jgi:hypothetical protein
MWITGHPPNHEDPQADCMYAGRQWWYMGRQQLRRCPSGLESRTVSRGPPDFDKPSTDSPVRLLPRANLGDGLRHREPLYFQDAAVPNLTC